MADATSTASSRKRSARKPAAAKRTPKATKTAPRRARTTKAGRLWRLFFRPSEDGAVSYTRRASGLMTPRRTKFILPQTRRRV
jgi:hypothetical protein